MIDTVVRLGLGFRHFIKGWKKLTDFFKDFFQLLAEHGAGASMIHMR